MRICLTGASSFTGFWFASELARCGHELIANFSYTKDSYSELRHRRISALKQLVDCRFELPFGSAAFVKLVQDCGPDVLALHGAEVTGYRSWDFDAVEATRRNTANARLLFEALAKTGGAAIATGSVFEPFEGVGDREARSFNPYGLSKHLSFEVFRMEAERAKVALSKFIIPNPFGPLEEPRFTNYLVTQWEAGAIPTVGTPAYVRDNIHVDLLAKTYASLVGGLTGGARKLCPAGYIESQGQFANRFARELGRRFGKEFEVTCADQTDFSEPRFKVNDMTASALVPDWSEEAAWDAVADYYGEQLR